MQYAYAIQIKAGLENVDFKVTVYSDADILSHFVTWFFWVTLLLMWLYVCLHA